MVDLNFRSYILLSPGIKLDLRSDEKKEIFNDVLILIPDEVVERYIRGVSVRVTDKMISGSYKTSNEEKRVCSQQDINIARQHAISDNQFNQNQFFSIHSEKLIEDSFIFCAAKNVASKQAIDNLQNMLDIKCGSGNFENCAISQEQIINKTMTKTVAFLRHPFDRLILQFKKSRFSMDNVIPSRKILFSRHRYNKVKMKSKKGSHQFRQFILTSVLSPNSTILPITEVMF